jgi:hypothetical protein
MELTKEELLGKWMKTIEGVTYSLIIRKDKKSLFTVFKVDEPGKIIFEWQANPVFESTSDGWNILLDDKKISSPFEKFENLKLWMRMDTCLIIRMSDGDELHLDKMN